MLPAAPPPDPTPSQTDRPCVLHRGVVVAAVGAPAVDAAADTAHAMPASTMPESTHRAGFDVVISWIISSPPSWSPAHMRPRGHYPMLRARSIRHTSAA